MQPTILYCGDVALSWKFVYLCAIWLGTHLTRVPESFPRFALYSLTKIINMRDIYVLSSGLAVEVLSHSASYGASDPRDHLYALYGHPRLKAIASDIPVEYEIPVHVLYKTVFRWFVENDRNLDVLSCAQLQDHLDNDYPSWAPQWQKAEPTTSLVGWPLVEFKADDRS